MEKLISWDEKKTLKTPFILKSLAWKSNRRAWCRWCRTSRVLSHGCHRLCNCLPQHQQTPQKLHPRHKLPELKLIRTPLASGNTESRASSWAGRLQQLCCCLGSVKPEIRGQHQASGNMSMKATSEANNPTISTAQTCNLQKHWTPEEAVLSLVKTMPLYIRTCKLIFQMKRNKDKQIILPAKN